MDRLTESFKSYFGPSPTTEYEIGQYATEGMIDGVLSLLKDSGYHSRGQVGYVFGAGGHPKSSYTDMEGTQGIRVVFSESVLPRGLGFIPSYRGLVKADHPGALEGVFRKLMEQSTVIALIFDEKLETAFLESVRAIDVHGDHSFGIKTDPAHLIYLVDEDRGDSPTGMVHYMAYSASGPWQELLIGLAGADGQSG